MNPIASLSPTTRRWIVLLLFAILGLVAWQLWPSLLAMLGQVSDLPEPPLPPVTSEPLLPLPRTVAMDFRKVALGNLLFHDKRLSQDGTLACAGCHPLDRGGVDGLQTSIGVRGQVTEINAPTVFNSSLNFKQFWDGRADTLEQQIDGPIQNPMELGSAWPDVVAKLQQDDNLRRRFALIYPDGIGADNIKDAIATFERSLITPNSRFDRYLRGESQALSASELEGYRLFRSYGCVSCHQGANIGGNMFARFGVMRDYFKDRGNITHADLGRFNVTGDPQDKHVFKVPSLRNVALTAPYFHDASAQTLTQAVIIMGLYQLGVSIPSHDVMHIVAFLGSLTGDYTPPAR